MSESKRIKLWRSSKSNADFQYESYMRNPDAFNFSNLDVSYAEELSDGGEDTVSVDVDSPLVNVSTDSDADEESIISVESDTDSSSTTDSSLSDTTEYDTDFENNQDDGDDDYFIQLGQRVTIAGLEEELAQWVTRFRITRCATGNLLKILQKYHPNLPVDCRTLLQTQRTVAVQRIAGGDYHYFGLKPNLVSHVDKYPEKEELNIHLNIDGVHNFKSKNT